MNQTPFPYRDFVRALDSIEEAILQGLDSYLLLTAETGAGKTALLRALKGRLDRCRYRLAYFSQARQLRAMGFVRVLAGVMHRSCRRTHPETAREVTRYLEEEPQRLLIWFDDATELPRETLEEVRALVESNLDGASPITVLFVGLPQLRERFQTIPSLWRRLVVREELSGLTVEEIEPFFAHHLDAAASARLAKDSQELIFQHGRGIPGQMLPMARTVLGRTPGPVL